MSFLEIGMGGFFRDAASGWGPFHSLTAREDRKAEKDKAKQRLSAEAQTFEQQRALSQEEARTKALENLRAQVIRKLQQMEGEANASTAEILKIRKASANPALRGDEILEELGAVLADMEKAVISIQAGTVVDTATFETESLAASYADAQAGLIAMRSVTARAQSVLKSLKERVRTLEAERARFKLDEA
ncbi:unnamed protein product, partial [marine sediment metagenome]